MLHVKHEATGWQLHLLQPLPLPHPDEAPHAALVTVVGLHLQHMGAAGLSVQRPAASGQQPAVPVNAEQTVAVACVQRESQSKRKHILVKHSI